MGHILKTPGRQLPRELARRLRPATGEDVPNEEGGQPVPRRGGDGCRERVLCGPPRRPTPLRRSGHALAGGAQQPEHNRRPRSVDHADARAALLGDNPAGTLST
jgi:hypothetical protein